MKYDHFKDWVKENGTLADNPEGNPANNTLVRLDD